MAQEITTAWSAGGAFADLWLKPGEQNSMYKSANGPSLELLKAFRSGLANVRDLKLLPAVGMKRLRPDGPFAPKARAPFDLSELSVATFVANLEGLLDMYDKGGFRAALATDDANMATMVADEVAGAIKLMREAMAHGAKAFTEPDHIARLAGARVPMAVAFRLGGDALERTIAGEVLGFVDSDGD